LYLWTRVERYFKDHCLRFLENHIGKEPLDPAVLNDVHIQRILVIRQHDQLGDLLLSTPVFRALKTRFPDAHVTVIVRAYTEQILRYHPCIDEVLTFQEYLFRWTPRKAVRFWQTLRSGFDLAIVLNTVSHSLSSDMMAALSRAPFVLGPDHLVFRGCTRNFYYNLLAPYAKKEKHQSQQNLDVLRYIGIDTKELNEEIGLSAEEKTWAKVLLRQKKINLNQPVIGIHPGAGKLNNRWPADRFAETANRLREKLPVQIILFQGLHETHLVEQVCRHLNNDCIVLGELSLRQLAAIVSELHLFLCNDTGVMHVAASVGTPLVAIFGPTDPDLWKPWGEDFIAIRGKDQSVQNVEIETVLKKSVKILKKEQNIWR
jgi:heptosyltransferase-3